MNTSPHYMYKCILIESDTVAADTIFSYLDKEPHLQLCHKFSNITDALLTIKETDADIIFINAHLVHEQHKAWLYNKGSKLQIIFSGAQKDFLLDNAVLPNTIYLRKPLVEEVLDEAVKQATAAIDVQQNLDHNILDHMLIKVNGHVEKVLYTDVQYLESRLNYVMVHCKNKRYLTYSSLKNFDVFLPNNLFVKVQKSFIVNKSCVSAIASKEIQINALSISISRQNREQVLASLR